MELMFLDKFCILEESYYFCLMYHHQGQGKVLWKDRNLYITSSPRTRFCLRKLIYNGTIRNMRENLMRYFDTGETFVARKQVKSSIN